MKALWEHKKLGEVLTLEYGKPLPPNHRKADGKYPVFGANGIKNRTDKYYYDQPSIIIGRKGSAGETTITNENFWPLDVTYFTVFDQNKYDLKFLFYLLRNLQLQKLAKGVKPGINRNEVYSIEANFPPLPEQQRIVDILDQSIIAIDQAIGNTEKNLSKVKDLQDTNLHSIFSKPEFDWKNEKLGKISKLVRGPFGGSLKKSFFVDDGYAVYEQSHAITNQFNKIRYFISDTKFEEMKRFEIKPRDLIMSCSGTMGKVAIVPDIVRKGIINQALLKITPNECIINEFLKYWMESADFQGKLDDFAMGAAIKNVASVGILKEIIVPVPPIEKQRTIIIKIKTMEENANDLGKKYKNKLGLLQELKQSILHKAFNGEL